MDENNCKVCNKEMDARCNECYTYFCEDCLDTECDYCGDKHCQECHDDHLYECNDCYETTCKLNAADSDDDVICEKCDNVYCVNDKKKKIEMFIEEKYNQKRLLKKNKNKFKYKELIHYCDLDNTCTKCMYKRLTCQICEEKSDHYDICTMCNELYCRKCRNGESYHTEYCIDCEPNERRKRKMIVNNQHKFKIDYVKENVSHTIFKYINPFALK